MSTKYYIYTMFRPSGLLQVQYRTQFFCVAPEEDQTVETCIENYILPGLLQVVTYKSIIHVHTCTWRVFYTTDSLLRPPTSIPFTAIAGLNTGLPRSASPLQFLELFLTVNVWQYILQTTNNYARVRLGSMPPRQRSVFRNWRDVTCGDKGICRCHYSDWASTTLRYQGLLVHPRHPQLSIFPECLFPWSVPPDILDVTCGGHTDHY